MTEYVVNTQDEWSALISGGDATFSDYIHIRGAVTIDAPQADKLDIYIEAGGVVVAKSGSGNAYTMCGGKLSITWCGSNRDYIYASEARDAQPVVELVGWPSDKQPCTYGDNGVPVRVVRVDSAATGEPVGEPPHYTWVGEALAQSGAPEFSANLQSWDLLDALFPDNPHLWNVGKYLTRFGRKGDASKRLEDLRKAAAYIERAIKAEERNAN
jgi:hypothetical protein|nr:MAG TPA: nucelotide kinase [Caudoviricetes sp.]